MRIAFFSIHGYVDPEPNLGLVDTGGQVVYVLEIAKRLGENGIHVDIFTRRFDDRRKIEWVSENVRIIRIPCGPKHFLPKEELFPYLDEYVKNLIGFVEKESLRYDILHSHYWDAGYVVLRAREKLGAPMVHTSHSLGLIKKRLLGEIGKKVDYKFDVRIKTEREILEQADKLVSASPIEPELVRMHYGIRREFEVVPPGVDIDFFNPKYRKVDVELPKKYVFTTGRIEWTKGFDLLVKAFRYVVDAHGDVKLIIGGGSTQPSRIEIEVRRKLYEISRSLGIEENIIQTGRIPNELLPAYYAKSRLVVLPSRYDLFGMVAIEAMACGRPVIVSKNAGVHKLISEEYGYVVDPHNERELSERIIELLDNPEKAEAMGRRGRRYVEKNLTWEKLAQKLRKIYESILDMSQL